MLIKNHKLTYFLESFKKEAFLQSDEWLKFQKSVGRSTFHVEDDCKVDQGFGHFCVWANAVEHSLPIVGKYLYIPRGPIMIGKKDKNILRIEDVRKTLEYLFWLAKDSGAGWVRFDPRSEKDLILIRESVKKAAKRYEKFQTAKTPHDVQPKEIFVIDISKTEDQLLSEMKSKTRYNIRLAEKKGVEVREFSKKADKEKYVEEFLKLNRETAKRDGFVSHSDGYYRKMVETLPEDMISLYVAEHEGKAIAANLVIFFGDTATYAHGASSNEHRDVMAPYLLQWRQIQDAKERGCKYYDFGGVKMVKCSDLTPALSLEKRGSKGEVNSWEGITRFKLGFSTTVEPIVFPGSYDIIINSRKYSIYKGLQRAKNLLRRIRK